MNNKLMKILIISMIILGIGMIYLMITNPKLYCKYAMFSTLSSVPVICLQDAIQNLNQ